MERKERVSSLRRPNVKQGDKFNRWTVLRTTVGNRRALCRCDCGTEREVVKTNLLSGNSKCCGCDKANLAKNITNFWLNNTEMLKPNITGYAGVAEIDSGRFQARLRHKGKVFYLGTYDTPQQAHNAYVAAKAKLRSEQ